MRVRVRSLGLRRSGPVPEARQGRRRDDPSRDDGGGAHGSGGGIRRGRRIRRRRLDAAADGRRRHDRRRGHDGTAGTGATGAAGTEATGAAGTGATGTAGSNGTSGSAGAVGAGGTAGAGTCAGCKINVTYTCLSGASDSRSFSVEAKDTGTMLVLLKELTLRYWYTADATKAQELDCDTAHLTCAYIITNQSPPPAQPKYVAVTPPRTKANEYVEIAFVQGAIDVGGTTGPTQLRLHNKDFSPIDQTQDYSADCGQVGQAHDSGKITAYIRGVLVGGTEPQ